MSSSDPAGIFGSDVFLSLQQKIDEETAVKEQLRELVQALEKQDRYTASVLAKAHATKTADLPTMLAPAQDSITRSAGHISMLSEFSSKYPYYKYSFAWTHQIQTTCFLSLYSVYLGGKQGLEPGHLLTLEEVGEMMSVPTNVKDKDVFHLTIEEYLHALISLMDELSRLARNSVTLGDYARPMQISQLIKDVHAGFQILNLKNDSLRKRSDGLKYKVKEVEDVVYDLSLRGLVPKQA